VITSSGEIGMMLGVFRYVVSLTSALLIFLAAIGPVAGEASSGPRLAYARDGRFLSGEELLATDLLATRSLLLYRHPAAHSTFRHLSWSPDGSRIAFASHGFGLGERIYTVSGEGGGPEEVAGTQLGFAPVFSPDGGTIAFARSLFDERSDGTAYWSTSIWLVDSRGGQSRRLTPWRDGLILTPSSFSPDGAILLAESAKDEVKSLPGIVSVPTAGGSISPVIEEGVEPAYSPNGRVIAFIRPRWTDRVTPLDRSPVLGGDLFTARADGSRPIRLTFTLSRREAHPSWDPSGERLAFAQLSARPTNVAQKRGTGSSIVQMNSDGSCKGRILFARGISYREPAWQPGPGREAGPIVC
jgi:Tol biopolymer transport system component